VEAESSKLEAEARKRKDRRESLNKLSTKASAKIAPMFEGRRASQSPYDGFTEIPDPGSRKGSIFGGLPSLFSKEASLDSSSESHPPSPMKKDSGESYLSSALKKESGDTLPSPTKKNSGSGNFGQESGTLDSQRGVLEQVSKRLALPDQASRRRPVNRGVSGDGFMILDDGEEKPEDPPTFLKDTGPSVSMRTFRDVKNLLVGQRSVRGHVVSSTPPVEEPDIDGAVSAVASAYGQQNLEQKDDEVTGPRRSRTSFSVTSTVQKAFGQILGTKHAPVATQDDSAGERKRQFKARIKTHYRKQNFADVFVFQNPSLFHTLINIAIACNSLYLALWTTNFAIIANRGHHPAHSALLIVLSLLPALFALPFISQAIKSSSILKAVTKLNLDVVSSVVEKTETRIKVLEDLRRKLTHHLEKETQDMVIGKAEINSLYEQYNLENPCGLSREEFIELLEGSRIHYTRHKCRTIFTALDLNRDGFISMEVPSLLSYSLSPPPPSSLCRSSSGSSSRRRLSRTISRKGNSSMRRTASCSEEWASTPQRRGS
jgi:hypothetical protein